VADGDHDLPTFRIGFAGPPGAGKSTLIEALGVLALEAGHRVAVLTVDPSSTRTHGSILGA
jgi:LAO/AO transport system kinase